MYEFLIITAFAVAAFAILYLYRRTLVKNEERARKTEHLLKRIRQGEDVDTEKELRAIYGDKAYERAQRKNRS